MFSPIFEKSETAGRRPHAFLQPPTLEPPAFSCAEEGAASAAANMSLARVSVCAMNQWSLDFEGNCRRVAASIDASIGKGARYRVGPELELSGYSCEDHFFEPETSHLCWTSLGRLMRRFRSAAIIYDVGMPVFHENRLYNCRVWVLGERILWIRPKMHLANDGSYRESRWFVPWDADAGLGAYRLPGPIAALFGQQTAPFGHAIVRLADGTSMASEMCEEMFVPAPPSGQLALKGVEIITNGSASYYEMYKAEARVHRVVAASARICGAYVYANALGCDGGRFLFDGGPMVAVNGALTHVDRRFSLEEVQVLVADIALDRIRAARLSMRSLCFQSATAAPTNIGVIDADFSIASAGGVAAGTCLMWAPRLRPGDLLEIQDGSQAQLAPHADGLPLSRRVSGDLDTDSRISQTCHELALAITSYLWDYLRRSGASGFFVPLSGGGDSACVALLVAMMCYRVSEMVGTFEDWQTRFGMGADACPAGHRSENDQPLDMESPAEGGGPPSWPSLSKVLLRTAYLATKQSSRETQDAATVLARRVVHATHDVVNLDAVVTSFVDLIPETAAWRPRFAAYGGRPSEDLAMQNIQARARMVASYMLAASTAGADAGGFRLVLGTGNLCEMACGYFTKYDCSSADLNPIGSLSKVWITRIIGWASRRCAVFAGGSSAEQQAARQHLQCIALRKPTAELRPLPRAGHDETLPPPQTDEADLGITYARLADLVAAFQEDKAGPVEQLAAASDPGQAQQLATFFRRFGRQRHKTAVLTPAVHLSAADLSDSRHSHRPILYPSAWGAAANPQDESGP